MPFHLPFHPKAADLRRNDPDAFDLRLRLDNERLKIPIFRGTGETVGHRVVSPTSSMSILARLYRMARLVLFVDHQTMRVK